MKVSDIVRNKINRFKSGYVFTHDDFDIPVNNIGALKMALSRLVNSGKIIRLSKGQFYKPEITEFGVLSVREIIKSDFQKEKWSNSIEVIHRDI